MQATKQAKSKRHIEPRHRIIRDIAYWILYPYARLRYGIRIDKFRESVDRNYLILLNHQTPFDQFFVGMAFRKPVYYLATEDIFSLGWISSVIRWLVAPIPIKKQTTDIAAVMNCIRVAREGGSICIAPEGNRTYSGRTEYMSPAIAGLARKMGLPILLYRLEGGYGTEPRWSDTIRRGKMRGYVAEVIEPEEYAEMTNEALFQRIQTGLFVDEATDTGLFKGTRRAEYLERMAYIGPFCGLAEWESHENEVTCKRCGRKVLYGEDKRLTGVGFEFPFPYVAQWYDYQKDFMNGLNVTEFTREPMFLDTADLSEVIVYKEKRLLRKDAALELYGDRVVIDSELVLPFGEISAAAVLGRNKLNLYHKDMVYQVRGSKRFNALKYVHTYNRWKNITRGDENGKFLGL